MNWQAGIVGAFLAVGMVCLVVLVAHEVRKGPPKRNRRTGLPPPSDACQRSPDWRASELKSPRGYVP